MRIGILTFHAPHNYGSMLQAFALMTFLKRLGHDTEIINFRSEKQKQMYCHPLALWNMSRHKIKETILSPNITIQNIFKWNLFESFMSTYLECSREYGTWDDVEKELNNNRYDTLVVGSDQIWNFNCKDADIAYFLPFENANIRKISYAASFGGNIDEIIKEPYCGILKKYLSSFYALSVREFDSAHVLSSLLNRPVSFVPDPTLLLCSDDYLSLISPKPIINFPYLLYYSPFPNQKDFRIAQFIAKRFSLPMVVTNSSHFMGNDIIVYNKTGPSEFLNLLKNANVICGNSFHMLVFSLIFHKEFYVLGGLKELRKRSLLERLFLQQRSVDDSSLELLDTSKIDYEIIDKKIDDLRYEGMRFLTEII